MCEEHIAMINTKQIEMRNSSRLEIILNVNLLEERVNLSNPEVTSLIVNSNALPIKVSDFALHARKLVIASKVDDEEKKEADKEDLAYKKL